MLSASFDSAGTFELTFGKTNVGARSDQFLAERKRVNRYTLPASGEVTKLSIYLAPTSVSGSQVLEGVIYADAAGRPEALLAKSQPLTFTSASPAGWYALPFASPVALAAGTYWIGVITGPGSHVAGFRYDSVGGSRDYNANSYAAGPSNPFGDLTVDPEQMSLYATYTTSAVPQAPPPSGPAPPTPQPPAPPTPQPPAPPLAPSSEAGRVKYRLDAASYFDAYSGETAWITAHIARIVGYAPFADRYTAVVPTVSYHDAFTTWGRMSLNPTHRAEYVAWVKRDVEHGYAGQFMDDLEWAGSGQNEPGSDAEVLALIEAVRAAIGPSGVLELNTQPQDLWARMREHNPYVEKALTLVNQIDDEFGARDYIGSYAERLAYVSALHAKGIHIDLTHAGIGDEYSLATYLLLNDGGDYIGGHATPKEWWSGWETNLGEAVTGYARLANGIYERLFAGGAALVAPPGVSGTVTLPRPMSRIGTSSPVTSVTLSGGQGAVLQG